MSDAAIRCEELSKQYRIGERERYKALRDTLTDLLYAPARRIRSTLSRTSKRRPNSGSSDNILWALKDVSFEVKHGEVIGIIGRNGAGKSTLLKILSRITRPTKGEVAINGRVGSLLEVGTGFHPELTGRENIFLNGAILGMKKEEIRRKFDEIVAFAEIERFIETPVKRYSSGMYVRLAFGVAAHMEPNIMLVDEVLAVGDSEFQKKCIGKMGEAAGTGRTVIFVSHQLNQIRRLCSRSVWLEGGRIRQVGDTSTVVSAYESDANREPESMAPDVGDDRPIRFIKWEIVQSGAGRQHTVNAPGPLTFSFSVRANKPLRLGGHHTIGLYNGENQLMWGTEVYNFKIEAGNHELVYKLDALPLYPGTYFWRLAIYDETGVLDSWECKPGLIIGTKPVTNTSDKWTGLLNIEYDFRIESLAVVG